MQDAGDLSDSGTSNKDNNKLNGNSEEHGQSKLNSSNGDCGTHDDADVTEVQQHGEDTNGLQVKQTRKDDESNNSSVIQNNSSVINQRESTPSQQPGLNETSQNKPLVDLSDPNDHQQQQHVIQTNPDKSAFMAPMPKTEEYPLPQQQQQQHVYQHHQQQQPLENDFLKLGGNNLATDYCFRNGGATIQPTNNWGNLEDMANIGYGQPPPNHTVAAAAAMMATPNAAMTHQMAMRRPLTSGNYQQQQFNARQTQQQYQQPNHYILNRQSPYNPPPPTGWLPAAGGSSQNNWSAAGMPPSGMNQAGMAWGGNKRMGSPHQQYRNKVFGGYHQQNQYVQQQQQRRRSQHGYGKVEMMGQDDMGQVSDGKVLKISRDQVLNIFIFHRDRWILCEI